MLQMQHYFNNFQLTR